MIPAAIAMNVANLRFKLKSSGSEILRLHYGVAIRFLPLWYGIETRVGADTWLLSTPA